jgi:Family of unknown function (DUF6498)
MGRPNRPPPLPRREHPPHPPGGNGHAILAPDGIREKLRTFFLVAIPFTFGAAVLTGAVLLIRDDDYVLRPRELFSGLAVMLVFQLVIFLTDLRRLRGINLPDAETYLTGALGRVFLLAFAVWAGLLLAFFVNSAFVIPFIVLKTIVDVGGLWSSGAQLKQRLVR